MIQLNSECNPIARDNYSIKVQYRPVVHFKVCSQHLVNDQGQNLKYMSSAVF